MNERYMYLEGTNDTLWHIFYAYTLILRISFVLNVTECYDGVIPQVVSLSVAAMTKVSGYGI